MTDKDSRCQDRVAEPCPETTRVADRLEFTEHGSLKLRVKYPGGEANGTVLVP